MSSVAALPFSAAVGSAGAPAYSFTGDLNTGMSAAVADTLVLSTAGTARLTLTSAASLFAAHLEVPAGSVGAPAVALSSEVTTGIFFSAGLVRMTSVGAEVARFGATSTNIFSTQLYLPDGTTAATPDLSWSGDSNTGFYRPSADEIGFSLGGTGFLVGYRTIPQQLQNGNYTLVLTDSGKHVYKASGGAGETITIPANGSVAYPVGTAITFINQGGGTLSIAITTDTMTLMGSGATGTRTLADDGIATAIKVAATEWVISGTALT